MARVSIALSVQSAVMAWRLLSQRRGSLGSSGGLWTKSGETSRGVEKSRSRNGAAQSPRHAERVEASRFLYSETTRSFDVAQDDEGAAPGNGAKTAAKSTV